MINLYNQLEEIELQVGTEKMQSRWEVVSRNKRTGISKIMNREVRRIQRIKFCMHEGEKSGMSRIGTVRIKTSRITYK